VSKIVRVKQKLVGRSDVCQVAKQKQEDADEMLINEGYGMRPTPAKRENAVRREPHRRIRPCRGTMAPLLDCVTDGVAASTAVVLVGSELELVLVLLVLREEPSSTTSSEATGPTVPLAF